MADRLARGQANDGLIHEVDSRSIEESRERVCAIGFVGFGPAAVALSCGGGNQDGFPPPAAVAKWGGPKARLSDRLPRRAEGLMVGQQRHDAVWPLDHLDPR